MILGTLELQVVCGFPICVAFRVCFWELQPAPWPGTYTGSRSTASLLSSKTAWSLTVKYTRKLECSLIFWCCCGFLVRGFQILPREELQSSVPVALKLTEFAENLLPTSMRLHFFAAGYPKSAHLAVEVAI